MAEFVNQRLEEMVPELEQMKRIELYTSEEIKEISRKRKDFEYKLQKQTRCKEDFLSYIAYECLLLKDISVRRKKSSITEKRKNIEYSMSRRINKLYQELIFRFPGDLELWINFFMLSKEIGFLQSVSRSLERMLQVHGDKPKVWQLASRWEFNEASNLDTARKFLLKGLHRHPDSKMLYLEAFKLELLIAESNDDDEAKDLQLKRANVILENALSHVSSISFFIDVCKIVNEFSFATELHTRLFTELWEKHKDKKEAWNFIAYCELEGKSTECFDWKSISSNVEVSDCPENLKNFFHVYETAISQFDKLEMYDYYIKSAIELSVNENVNSEAKVEILKSALQKGHNAGRLTEEFYKIWIEMLSFDYNITRDEIVEILEEASNKLPSSEYIWEERLKRATSMEKEFDSIFSLARKKLPKNKGVLIWKIAIENAKSIEKLNKLYNDSLSVQPAVGKELKHGFLKRYFEFGEIETARKQYSVMVKTPPFSLEMHREMMKLENNLVLPSYKNIRNCYELAIQQFGDKDIQIWLDYIKFESENNHSDLCGTLYKKACLILKNKQLSDFIKLHCLNKDI